MRDTLICTNKQREDVGDHKKSGETDHDYFQHLPNRWWCFPTSIREIPGESAKWSGSTAAGCHKDGEFFPGAVILL